MADISENILSGNIEVVYNGELYSIRPKTSIDQVQGYTEDVAKRIEDTIIQKTAAEWELASDTVIGKSVIAFATDTGTIKFGNGTSKYSELKAISVTTVDASNITNLKAVVDAILDPVPIPYQTNIPTYDGTEQTLELTNYDSEKVSIVSGSLKATEAGTTYIQVQLTIPGSKWSDGTSVIKSIPLVINPRKVSVPTKVNDLVYTGNPQTLVSGFNNATMKLTDGNLQETNAGTYTLKFVPYDNNNVWDDGSSSEKTVNITIDRKVVTSNPTQKTALTYNGNEQTVTWDDLDTTQLTAGGTQKATNAGTHVATMTPTSNYKFSDGSTTAKNWNWKIDQKSVTPTVSKSSISLNTTTTSTTFTVTREGDGTISAVSNSTSVATVSQNGNVFTVTGQATGNTSITVTVQNSTNYKYTSNTLTVSVAVQFIPTALNDADWDTISSLIKAGTFGNYYKVGAWKNVTFNSANVVTGSSVSAVSGTYRAVVIGIDHNSSIEGTKRVHFAIIKNTSDVQIAICDTDLNSISGAYTDYGKTDGFIMNPPNKNDEGTSGGNQYGCNLGGWKSSYGRRKVAQGFYDNIFPSSLKTKISRCTKWTDNVGNNTNVETNLSATEDYVWFLAEFEIFGARTYANSYEQNKQSQYEYFKNGSKVCYKNGSTATAVYWWERSPRYINGYYFCIVNTSGGASNSNSSNRLGVVPCFTLS